MKELSPLLSALQDISRWFSSQSIPHIFIGGVAASILGTPRVTQDVDSLILLDDDSWEKLYNSASHFSFQPRISDALDFARRSRVLLMRHEPSGIDVDISFAALPFEEEALKKAISVKIEDVKICLPLPEDLIIMKAVAHRPKDLADIGSILEVNPHVNVKRIKKTIKEFSELLELPDIYTDLESLLKRYNLL